MAARRYVFKCCQVKAMPDSDVLVTPYFSKATRKWGLLPTTSHFSQVVENSVMCQ
uniref:Uncharacterized protein n=1 Tax=Vitis vinifera TaxID=29760 RepID=F6H4S2_VITVI